MKKKITTIILSLLFILSAGSVKAQITFDLVIIFKKNAKEKDIEKMKKALNAVQLDSTYPSRALLWRCKIMPGTTIELPKIVGGSSIVSINNSSDAVGVVCGTGQSEGVSSNNFWAIPQSENSEDVTNLVPPFYGSNCTNSSTDSIITCQPGSRPIKIAIMDSGIDCDLVETSIKIAHDSIRPYVGVSTEKVDGVDGDVNGYVDDQIGYDFVNNTGVPKDSSGHGTFVAGVVSRILKYNKADNIKLSILKVLDKSNRGYEFDFIRALDYAVRQKVDVVNCSFVSSSAMTSEMQPFAIAIEAAQQAGVLVSLAAGNNSKDIDQSGSMYAPSSFQNENTIVTGATVCTDSIASFSNYGRANVDIFAPSKRIVSTWIRSNVCQVNCYAYHTGTSFAAPQTTAIAALLSSNLQSSDWSRVKCSILNSATFKNFLVDKCRRAGILNGVNALIELGTNHSSGSCNGIVAAPKKGKISSARINAYPNPFSGNIAIDISLPSATALQMSIFNVAGELISKRFYLGNEGDNTVILNDEDTGMKGVGMYYIKVQAGEDVFIKKVVKVGKE